MGGARDAGARLVRRGDPALFHAAGRLAAALGRLGGARWLDEVAARATRGVDEDTRFSGACSGIVHRALAPDPPPMMTPSQRAAMRALVGEAAQQGYLPGSGSGHPGTLDRVAGDRRPLGAHRAVQARVRGPRRHRARGQLARGSPRPHLTPRNHLATSRVLAWNDDAVGLAGLQAGLTAAGLTLAEPHLDQSGARRDTQMAELDAASIGITGVDAAIADTGSLIVASGPGRPRLASLLTPVHVAIVRPRDIVTSLRSLIRARPSLVTQGQQLRLHHRPEPHCRHRAHTQPGGARPGRGARDTCQ